MSLGRTQIPFLGVSLSNRAFSFTFARRLAAWLHGSYSQLEVLLGDECEAINYQVFRGLDQNDGRQIARRRADEIGRMFQRASRSANFPIFTTAESKYVAIHKDVFDEALTTLQGAFKKYGVFSRDVHSQVRINLLPREKRLPPGFVSSHLDDLAMYVVRELALFYTLRTHKSGPDLIELYPGPQLFVKERLFAGKYSREIDLAPLGYSPVFVNVAFLVTCEGPGESIAADDDLYTIDGDAAA